jgi:quercetin dioxygenase-like cupin family protein
MAVCPTAPAIYIADVMPGAEGGRHIHYGDKHVHALEGTLVITPDGQQPITLRKGDVVHIAPRDGVQAARNGSNGEPAKVLVFLVAESGGRGV